MRVRRAASFGLVLVCLITQGPLQAEQEPSVGLFTRKQEVRMNEFCRDFYEKNILNPVLQGVLDAGAAFVEVVKKELVEVDPKLANIDEKMLAEEMVLLRFEIFGLAWVHKFDEKSSVAQSAFTKHYLHEKGRDDIWENMEFYNQAVARSSTLRASDPKAPDYRYLAKVNKTRADLFDKFLNEGVEPGAIARALNRLFTEAAWENDDTRMLLMFGLYDHLGFGPSCAKDKWANEEAQFRLKGVILGLYKGASEAIEEVKIVNKTSEAGSQRQNY